FADCAVESFGAQEYVEPAPRLNGFLQLEHNRMVCVGVLFRREVFAEHGCWFADLPGYEDWSFWHHVAARRLRGAQVEEPLARYRGRFLVPLAPVDLDALAGARPSLLELATRALEARADADALVASLLPAGDAPFWPAPWPRERRRATGELLLYRAAAARELR